jgi:hypothetical protein
MANVIKFEALEVEVLIGIANESAELVESSARKAVEHAERCGRALLAAKAKVPHGKWLTWLGANWDYSQPTASRYMSIASNYSSMTNLKEAKDVNDALRLIADNSETPKRERKPSVEVVEVAADEPADDVPVAAEIVTENKPAVEGITAVATVKPVVATKPETATAEPEVEKKTPSVIQIQHTLIKMGKDKKRHPQLMQIANDALYRLALQDRGMVICKQLLSMTPEERDMVYASVDHMMKKEKPDQLGS